jgi:hypothetical protein
MLCFPLTTTATRHLLCTVFWFVFEFTLTVSFSSEESELCVFSLTFASVYLYYVLFPVGEGSVTPCVHSTPGLLTLNGSA